MKQRWRLPRTALVVHNALTGARQVPYRGAPLTANDTAGTAREIDRILRRRRVDSRLFPVASVGDLDRLAAAETEFAFNCVDDDIGTTPNSSHLVPVLFQKKRIPYSGASGASILLTGSKAAVKKLCRKHSILTPDFWLAVKPEEIKHLPCFQPGFFPAIIKPANMDGSEGISQDSVVNQAAALIKQVQKVMKVFHQPVLVEQYIFGREISQSVLELRRGRQLFPPAEIVFTRGFQPRYKIVDFKAKWRRRTNEFAHTRRRCPADLPVKLAQRLERLAGRIWRRFRLTSYARFDFRLDDRGRFWLLEINANPDISHDQETGFPAAARAAGYSYEDLILQIVDKAMFKFKYRE